MVDPSSLDVRTTAVGTLEATWKLVGHAARIQLVRTALGDVMVSYTDPECPDLADARQQRPDLAPLWNAVRHDLWTELAPPPHRRSGNV
ncbi:hypothetical protein [Nocardia nova]|uniref:hypothetical protein n=1 Tax=Nocardia nova TaxID=37330 RepID=UPI0033C91166